MASGPPKIRRDLTVSEQRSGDGRLFILKDPATGKFFRLREPEHFIVGLCDGETPMEEVRRRVEAKFETTLSLESLTGFLGNLEKAGLLTTQDGEAPRPRSGGSRISGDLLYLRFRLLNPAWLFRILSPLVWICFTPFFLFASAVAIVVAAATAAMNWNLLLPEFVGLLDPSNILLYVVVVFLTVSMHEFAHGLTCNHFGGDVREVGFLLMYFQPCLYCNVSDAWLFPRKSQRLWVGFAGPYFELFLWAIAVIFWRVTDGETWINRVALIVVASSGIKTLFNFNPLIKLDGYYLLSDYLEIPNLRKKSFRYLGTLFRRLFGLEYRQEEASNREKRIYLVYGFTAALASCSLLGYVFVTGLGYIAGGGAFALVGLFTTALVGFRARKWIRRIFGRRGKADLSDDDGELEAPRSGSSGRSKRKRSRGWVRWLRRLVWLAVWIAAFAGIWHALNYAQADLRVAGAFRILPANVDARTEVDGLVDRIFVDEGDTVRAGDVVARLSGKDLVANLQKTEAEIKELQASLGMLEAGPSRQEIAVAEAGVAKEEENLKYAQSQLARAQEQLSAAVLSRNSYERVREQVITAEGDMREAKARLNAVLASVRPEQISVMQARIERLEAERGYIEDQLRYTLILSPANGTVGTPSVQLKRLPRQYVKKGDLILTVNDYRTVSAEITVSEKEISEVKIGQTAELRARAFPELQFTGRIRFVATSAQGNSVNSSGLAILSSAGSSSRGSDVLVIAAINNRALTLKPEMTGQAKIYIEKRRLLNLIERRLARMFKVEFWALW